MKNTLEVLERVEYLIQKGEYRYRMYDVCDELSIFDWWKNFLTVSDLKDMRKFLREAHKLGYDGYVCFKVGVTGCANGMWAHKKESTTGYSPDGECLFKSFTPAYNYWQWCDEEETWYPKNQYPEDTNYKSCKTIKQLEKAMGYK